MEYSQPWEGGEKTARKFTMTVTVKESPQREKQVYQITISLRSYLPATEDNPLIAGQLFYS